MIRICCEKTSHTLYEMVNNALKILSLDLDVNIIGVDSVLSSPFNRSHMAEFNG